MPKAISVLLSHEAEKRLVTRRRGRETIPLAFRPKISFSPFDVCYPSPVLADCVNPAELALRHAGKWTAKELYCHAEQAVSKMLATNRIRITNTRSIPLWHIIARIESTSPQAPTIKRGLWEASRDALRYDALKAALSLYRLVLGQPRQQDIIESLLKMFPEADPSEIGKALVKYTINLSPIPKGHAARMAEHEARFLVANPQKLALTLEEVRHLITRESTGAFTPVTKEVRDLLHLAGDGGGNSDVPLGKRIKAISCLLYLLNPYDDLYDFHDGIGYQDDLTKLRQAHASLFPPTDVEQTS